jgi:hypothetical protein
MCHRGTVRRLSSIASKRLTRAPRPTGNWQRSVGHARAAQRPRTPRGARSSIWRRLVRSYALRVGHGLESWGGALVTGAFLIFPFGFYRVGASLIGRLTLTDLMFSIEDRASGAYSAAAALSGSRAPVR